MGTLHLPFDEVAMKLSGYVDGRCRRITDSELDHVDAGKNELRHVRIGSVDHINVVSQTETVPSTHVQVCDIFLRRAPHLSFMQQIIFQISEEGVPSREAMRLAFRPPRDLIVPQAKITQLDFKVGPGRSASTEAKGVSFKAGGKRYRVRVEGEIRVRPVTKTPKQRWG